MSFRSKIITSAQSAGSMIDEMASAISPSWGLRRRQMREVLSSYDGATSGRRASSWVAGNSDANASLVPFMWALRARARDLVRNNSYAARAVSVYQGDIVGTGIKPTYKNNDRLKNLLQEYIGGGPEGIAKPYPDSEMRKSLFGLQRLGEGERITSGEILFVREWKSRREMSEMGLPVPFQIRALEPEFLDESVDGQLDSDRWAVKGVEVNASGRIIAYHLFDHHPGTYFGAQNAKSRRVDAKDVIHLFREDRAGQVRGVTRFAPVMLKLRDFAQFEDVQLIRQKIAASYTVFMHKPHSEAVISGSGKDGKNEIEKVHPGMIMELPPGYDVRFGDPPGVDGFKDFANVTLHSIAAGLDLTYEQLTSDLSQVSFISGRMGQIRWRGTAEVIQSTIWGPSFCWQWDQWFREAAALVGVDDEGDRAVWSTPVRHMLSPGEETKSFRETVRSGLNSWQDEIRKTGRDPQEVLAEIKKDFEAFKSLEISLDSDPNQTTSAGMAQAQSEG